MPEPTRRPFIAWLTEDVAIPRYGAISLGILTLAGLLDWVGAA